MRSKFSIVTSATILALFLSGCGMGAAYTYTTPTLEGGKSDYVSVDTWAGDTVKYYKAKKGKVRLVGSGGAMALAGLATGVQAAAQSGAGPGRLSTLVNIGNFVQQLLGIYDPPERSNAYALGESAVEEARGDVRECLATGQPADSCTAALYKKVVAANRAVDAVLNHLIPDDKTIETLRAPFQNLVVIKAQTEVSNEHNHPPALGIAPPQNVPNPIPGGNLDPVITPLPPQ